jgi:glutamate racemase
LLLPVIRKFVPENIQILEQGKLVSSKLVEYLTRHPEMDEKCSKSAQVRYLTTENVEVFEKNATNFIGRAIRGEKILLK